MLSQSELDFNGRAEQQANLERVGQNIAGYVADFCRSRVREGRAEFHMADLTTFVNARSTIAPDSAGRILRDLRRRKVIDYEVVSRSRSLYRLKEVQSA